MDVKFSDTFKESLKRVYWQQTWIYKLYSFFKRDLWQFFANIYRFRQVLWNHRWWDYHFTLEAMKTSLQIMEKGLREKGIEEDVSRLKKVEKIQRVIQIIDNKARLDFVEMAEKELGPLSDREWEFEDLGDGTSRLIDNETPEEKEHARLVFARATELEREEWKELWRIIEGPDYTQYDSEKEDWNTWFDGSGLESWWD